MNQLAQKIKDILTNHGGRCPESQVLKELKQINSSITKDDVDYAVSNNQTVFRWPPVIMRNGVPLEEQEIELI